MALLVKKIRGGNYYYSFLSYRVATKPKSFSKYIGSRKPTEKELEKIENIFRIGLIQKLSGKTYSGSLVDKDEIVKSLLFSAAFNKKYQKLTNSKRRKYDIDSMVRFTLTTLTTEEVDVDLTDVTNALVKASGLTLREQISKNMLRAVESIKKPHKLDREYILELHNTIMSTFEQKSPGNFRKKQVYLYKKGSFDSSGDRELKYRPPEHKKVIKLLEKFLRWYNDTDLNPVEKAAIAHYQLYMIHPFLDGNKRICRLIFNKTLFDSKFPLINISINKEAYFDALIRSVETEDPRNFVEFAFKQYYQQIKTFLAG